MKYFLEGLLLSGVALLASAAPGAAAQQLPEAPSRVLVAMRAEASPGQNPGSTKSGLSSEEARERRKPAAPPLTMFPHSDTTPWWVSGQANIIFQGNLPFHSPYQGANSFLSRGEYKTSLVGTLFLGYVPQWNRRNPTEFIVDFESTGGRGLSQALGLAGFTNLDVVRNPNLGSKPYIARGEIHQTIALGHEETDAARGPLALSAQLPVRRLDLRLGKLSLPDLFDINPVGSDSHLQFTNWTVDNNGAWDYAADTRGYTVAATAEYDDRNWSARFGLATMPTVANGISLDWALSRAHAQNFEVEIRRSLLPGRRGATRLLSYINTGHMGDYREAVTAFRSGADKAPDIVAHRRFGAVKYGFGWNNEQDVTGNLRVFSRFGWNEGQHESFAYTEVDQTFEAGADYAGERWHRPYDKAGFAFVTNAIKRDHQNYLKYGGLGFLLGDGYLNYAREDIVESYYNLHAWRGAYYALGITHIQHPGYNQDRGPVWVGSVRFHVDF